MERQLGSNSSCLYGNGHLFREVDGESLCHLKAKRCSWWEDTKSLSCCHTKKPLFTTVKKALSGVEVPKVEPRSTWPGFTSEPLKMEILGLQPDLLSQNLWGWHPGIYILNKLPGYSGVPRSSTSTPPKTTLTGACSSACFKWGPRC